MNTVSAEERNYLRELAKRQMEYASLPVMAERTKRWYYHNDFVRNERMVVMELQSFEKELLPPSRCENPVAKELEYQLLYHTTNHELIDDDKVVPDFLTLEWDIHNTSYGFEVQYHHALDGQGRNIGFSWDHAIQNVAEDLGKFKEWEFSADREKTAKRLELAGDILGDIIKVVPINTNTVWGTMITHRVVTLMGMENMFTSFYDYPDEMHALCEYLTRNLLRFLYWQEAEGLLTLNNGNQYAGAGSFGFTTRLPKEGYDGKVRVKDLWLNTNSQESVGLSPDMYGEFVYPYARRLAEACGMLYYGCCEPVHTIWERYLKEMPNLEKVSISAWCNEEFMGQALKDSRVIYSRKPNPTFIGAEKVFNEPAFREHIRHTVSCAKDCNLEIIFRDIYTTMGERLRAKRAVEIVREEFGRA